MKIFDNKKEVKRIQNALENMQSDIIELNLTPDEVVNQISKNNNIPINLTKLLNISEYFRNSYEWDDSEEDLDDDWDDDLFKLMYVKSAIIEYVESRYSKQIDIPMDVFQEFLFDMDNFRGICGYKISNKKNYHNVRNSLINLFYNSKYKVNPNVFNYLKRTIDIMIERENDRRVYLNEQMKTKFKTINEIKEIVDERK